MDVLFVKRNAETRDNSELKLVSSLYLNQGPLDLQSNALPTELFRHLTKLADSNIKRVKYYADSTPQLVLVANDDIVIMGFWFQDEKLFKHEKYINEIFNPNIW